MFNFQLLKTIPFIIVLSWASTASAQDDEPSALGTSENPGATCRHIAATISGPSQIYWIQPDPAKPAFPAWCLMEGLEGGILEADERKGWTLVANNSFGGESKPFQHLSFEQSTAGPPRYNNFLIDNSYEERPFDFDVFLPLDYWISISRHDCEDPLCDGRREVLYLWNTTGLDPLNPVRAAYCQFSIDRATNYTLTIRSEPDGQDGLSCKIVAGDSLPAWFTTHNQLAWSTFDRDSDGNGTNCAASYEVPFWYSNVCLGSSPFGIIQRSSGSSAGTDANVLNNFSRNGAFWSAISAQSAKPDGTGAGYGLIFVR